MRWYGMVWYLAIFAAGCVDAIRPPGALSPGLDAGSTEVSEVIGEDDSVADAGLSDGSGEASVTRSSALIWNPGESWEPFLNFRNDSNVNHARHSHYGRAVAYYEYPAEPGYVGRCSGFMISRDRFVTAHHCTEGIATVEPWFMRNTSGRNTQAREALRQLGFVDGALLDAAVSKALGRWNCSRHSRESGRDIEYYTCWAEAFEIMPGYSVSLHPGDIFGYLDVTTAAPADGASTNNLTVNQHLTYTAAWEPLLSPGGERETYGSENCTPGYTGCATTQGDDTLKGSSGGATLRGSDNRAWGVSNGFRNLGADPLRSPKCFNSVGCAVNRNIWARFTQNTLDIQFDTRYSNVPTPSSTFGTPAIGGGGGNPSSFGCKNDEVVIGIVGSVYADVWNVPSAPPEVLGNFGVVCAPVIYSTGHFLQSDHATVYTAGSHDTASLASTSLNLLSYNRYRHIAVSNGIPTLSNEEVVTQLCPAGYALSGLTGLVKYGMVRRLTEMRCRHVFESRPVLSLPLNSFGRSPESGSVFQSLDCEPGREAVGASLRTGWFTDRISLFCF